jgi:hypothetical protein
MSAQTQTATGQTSESRCWCYGKPRSENTLVHLGNHPEVGTCTSCVRFRVARPGTSRPPCCARRCAVPPSRVLPGAPPRIRSESGLPGPGDCRRRLG